MAPRRTSIALANQNAVAYGYHDTFVHPSEPNYLWMVSGENFGVLDDDDPIAHHARFDVAPRRSDRDGRPDLEVLPGVDGRSRAALTSHDRYAAKHDPFVFFNDINGWDGTTFQPVAAVQRARRRLLAARRGPRGRHRAELRVHHAEPRRRHARRLGRSKAMRGSRTKCRRSSRADAFKHGGVLFLLWDEGSGTSGESTIRR